MHLHAILYRASAVCPIWFHVDSTPGLGPDEASLTWKANNLWISFDPWSDEALSGEKTRAARHKTRLVYQESVVLAAGEDWAVRRAEFCYLSVMAGEFLTLASAWLPSSASRAGLPVVPDSTGVGAVGISFVPMIPGVLTRSAARVQFPGSDKRGDSVVTAPTDDSFTSTPSRVTLVNPPGVTGSAGVVPRLDLVVAPMPPVLVSDPALQPPGSYAASAVFSILSVSALGREPDLGTPPRSWEVIRLRPSL